ncbi:D-Ala-D-Ala carboxypeptidase family metallohydrolase [Ensifer sp. BR816]|uniref:D-Ala-D-Ala carboxypeptidase family metallohydrolase n=1 Tax=Rhizobium sp. (strain BR816) TaxID=1057002 RepID=UPI000369C82E|nr:YcbK family protein [Ensifer sp. BR816]
MQQLGSRRALLSIGRAAAFSVSLITLAGCVSAVAESEGANPVESQQPTASPSAAAAAREPRDGQLAASGADTQQAGEPSAEADTAALQQGLTTQSTGLNATSSSIYGQSPVTGTVPANAAQPSGTRAGAGGQPGVNATSNSLFSGAQPAVRPVILPQEGASNATSTPTAVTESTTSAADLPSGVPLPTSAQASRSGEAAAPLQTIEVASTEQTAPPAANPVQPTSPGDGEKDPQRTSKSWTFASLFAAKRKPKLRNSEASDTPATEKRTITTGNAPEPRVASLAYTALPGVKLNPLFNMDHADHAGEEDDAPVEVANLSGLARLAPSGLILQTESVETGCFKPALLDMLKSVERHYGQKVMVTSGLRPIKVSRKRQSLHTRCEAADIQVKGVSKWDLADYLRSLPGRGGVGTYCHTESVHIDIGRQRDWNWRCRRRNG